MTRHLARAVMLAACVACGTAGAGGAAPGAAMPGARFGDDRVLVTEATEIVGVAVSRRYVFALTPSAVLVLDRQLGRWEPPLAATAMRGTRPTAIAADPVEDAVWVGSFGAVTYLRPGFDFPSSANVAGEPEIIMFDRRDPSAGAYVRSSGRWSLVTRTGFATPVSAGRLPPPEWRILTPTLRELHERYPGLAGFASLLTRDPSLRTAAITSGAAAPDRSDEVWLGTYGNGLFRVDPIFNRSEHHPFGLMERGAGALAPAADGVWIAALGADVRARSGLVFASADLQRWRWVDVAVASPLAGARVYDLAVRGDTAWVATDRGVVRLRTQDASASGGVSGAALSLYGGGMALALAVVPGGAWVGSTRGLLFVADSAREAPAAERAGGAVRALVRTGSTVWVGGEQGLFRMALDGGGLSRPPAARTEPRLAGRVTALAAADSEVVAALDGDLVRIAGADGRALPRWPALDPGMLRGVRAMAMDDRTLWVGGAAGVLVIGRRDGVARPLTIPRDVPGDVFDVLLDRDFAWIATRDGVLRVRRLPDGFPR